jgi:diadenosine tetraphosphate (Ap4A) HIT family hydrolase
MKKVVNKRFAKSAQYRSVLETIEKKEACPFCVSNFVHHKKPILHTAGSWFLTKNSWPYKKTRYHFLLINKKHKEYFSELTATDLRHIKTLVDWCVVQYRIKGGAFALRFGDTNHTGATVCHIHGHLIVPKLKKNGVAHTVQFPIG